ncbi:HAD family hydrolase [Catellatospora methionotrophica]|uniref:HAD family hydrolase n=1 Tax=Catellatospora methionotrophica TaxID=121620 RepID=UPI0033ECAE81
MQHSSTTTDDQRDAIPRLLVKMRTMVLSFDGPVCALSPALSSLAAAEHMRAVVAAAGHEVPPDLEDVDDPLIVMRYAVTLDDPGLTWDTEHALMRLEWEAMTVAVPTPGAHEAIRAARAGAKGVAIASDRSGWVIEQYLALHGLTDLMSRPIGRWSLDPQRWKPDTYSLLAGVQQTSARPKSTLFVGSTPIDVETASAAQVPFLGLAGPRSSAEGLRSAGAEHVLGSDGMLLLAAALRGPAGD